MAEFSLPIPFLILIWTQSHSAGLFEPTGDGWRIGLHPLDGLPAALVPLLGLVADRARLLALRCCRRRDLSASSPSWGCSSSRGGRATWRPAWSGRGRPGIMSAWRRSVVTITATGSGDAQGRRADADARLGRRERRLGGVDPRGADGGGGGVAVTGGA